MLRAVLDTNVVLAAKAVESCDFYGPSSSSRE